MFTIQRRAIVLALLILVGPSTGPALPAPDQLDAQHPHVYKANRGQFLAARANTTPVALVSDFLRGRGASDAMAKSLRSKGEHRNAKTGMNHLLLEQEVAGLRVHDAYVKAAFNGRGELVHVIENLAPVPGVALPSARIDEAQALSNALQN